MKALKERGLEFDAVAGTSAGGLCALIWATDSVAEGEQVWLSIGQRTFFGANPEGCVRRLTKIMLTAGKLFAAFVRGIELEGQPQFMRDAVFSVVLGVLYWFLLVDFIPVPWLLALCPIVVGAIALFAFANQLPRVGWDERTRRLLLDTLLWLTTTKVVLGAGERLVPSGFIAGLTLNLSWAAVLLACIVVLAILCSLDLRSTLIEGKRLASHIRSFLEKQMRVPTYVTVAKEAEPGSPHFLLPTPGVFACIYVRLDKAPPELAKAFAYASAALPFGILPSVQIGEHQFVDGGVADNTPALPLVMHELDEIWIIRLRPSRIDLAEHIRSVSYQQMLAVGPPAGPGHQLIEQWLTRTRVVQICPQTELGGMLAGTLNFAEHRSRTLVRQGFRTTMRVIANPGAQLRTYRLRHNIFQRVAFVLKALPGCSLGDLFGHGTADTSSPHPDVITWPLKLPNAVRPAKRGHAKPVRQAISMSVAVISASWAAAAFHEGRTLAGSLWAAFAVWLVLVFPSWWPRFRRMQGF